MDQFCGSPFWDWDVTWNTENPDFTPCFERTVLALVPCLFIWVFTAVDVYFSYTSASKEIPWSPLNIGKLCLTTLLVILEIGLLVVPRVILPAVIPSYVSYPVDLYVPAVRAATLILYATLLLYSKGKGVRSSGVQFLFWFFLTITQGIRFRTVIAGSYNDENLLEPSVFIMEVIYFPLVLGQLILHSWADVAPAYQLESEGPSKKACPEYTSSFLNRILFHWYTSLAWTGFRKPLEYSDLYELNWVDRSQNVVPFFDQHWPNDLNRGLNKKQDSPHKENGNGYQKHSSMEPKLSYGSNKSISKPEKEPGVFRTIVKAFGWSYFIGFMMRTTTDLMMFVSPQILSLLISFVGSDEPIWKGLMYATILFVNAFVGTLFNANGIHKFYMTGMRSKTVLISAVYRKALLLSNSAKRAESAGEIVNHMAVDVNYACEFSQYGYQLFGTPIIIAVALYFLWTILGPSAMAGVVVMFLLLPMNAFVASKIQKLQKQQMHNKDKRTKLMTEILSGMKVLKLYAWEPSFEDQVMKIRNDELRVLKHTAYLNSVSNFLWTCAPFLVAISTFGTYVMIDSNNVLDAQTAFVSLSLFNIMSQPLTFLPLLISGFIQASVAIKRLNKYLNADELVTDAVTHDENEPNPIVIEDGNFSWEQDVETLKDINFQVKDGELCGIVGPVGAGKSSLLSVLLNELIKTSGRVNTRGTLAYVAQQAWIQNATVRDNILFGKPYDPVKYMKVIEACALKPDLEILPAGDKTEIGEKGINLSGGQKQRISLARAVYSNAEVYLFDDPLSAVDAHVGKHIFEKVLGPKGMLRKKTRLLVTHGIVYLPFMDNISVMMDGRISESGTYQELLDKKGAFADFLHQHLTSEDVTEVEGTQAQKDLENALGDLTQIRQRKRLVSDSESEFSASEAGRRSRLSSSVTFCCCCSSRGDKLIETETAETEGVKASVYLDYFRAAGWGLTFATIAFYVVFQGFSVGTNLWLSEWTNLPVVNGTQDASERNFYLGIYAVLGFMQAVFILIATLIMALGTVKSANVLHFKMLQRILRAPLAFFDVTPIGRIVNRFSRDVDSMDNVLPMFLRFLLNGIFNVLATLVVISVSTPIFTAVILPVGLLYYFIQRFYVATSRQLKRLESITRSPIYSHFGETVSGASTIRAYNQQERFVQESEHRVDQNLMSYFCSVTANRWLQVRLETVGNTVVFFAALFAVLGRETLNAGLVGLSVSYAMQITMALIMLVRFTSDVETNIVAVERLKEYSNAPQEADWEVPSRKPKPSWPEAGQIIFNGYKTRYRPGLDLVLRNVTCKINPGEKIGIVGRTGAGKSSMTLALFRIVEASEGSIEIDGQNISRLGLHDVRGRITIIPQDPVLFSGSLRINLDPFDSLPDETLYHALELAHLRTFLWFHFARWPCRL
ncbi:Multidrug resistance-associated protein 1 [Orchesella cincta]|uniref:ABC-type glutathione-S-conjugate transporter n=1 Tax=Orchesella cincta TaxID=48709 RepID=A0A1D2M5L9_ORCCI|nr:Multidrug resistance-associated protein 1 [Orchesella cincta]